MFCFLFLFLHQICSQSLPFPTVTFCNFNPIRDESFRAMIEIGKMQNFSQLLSYGKSVLYLSRINFRKILWNKVYNYSNAEPIFRQIDRSSFLTSLLWSRWQLNEAKISALGVSYNEIFLNDNTSKSILFNMGSLNFSAGCLRKEIFLDATVWLNFLLYWI